MLLQHRTGCLPGLKPSACHVPGAICAPSRSSSGSSRKVTYQKSLEPARVVVPGRAYLQSTRNSTRRVVVSSAATQDVVTTPGKPSSDAVSTAYPFAEIEKKWQQYWQTNRTFRTPDEVDTSKPKYYVLDMFPYPRCV